MTNQTLAESILGQPWGEFHERLTNIRALEMEDPAEYLNHTDALVKDTAEQTTPCLMHAAALSERGNAQRSIGEFPEALAELGKAIELAEEFPASKERDQVLALTHLRYAIIGDMTGNLVMGFEHIDLATDFYWDIQDFDGLARCDVIRGALYTRIDDFEESEASYWRAQKHYHRTGNTEREAVALNNLTALLHKIGRDKEAVEVGRQALPLATNPMLKIAITGNYANALGAVGELDLALELHEEIWESLKHVNHPHHHITYKRVVGGILEQQKRFDEAIVLLEDALAMSEKHQMQVNIMECHGLLARIYGQTRDFEKAYLHQGEHHARQLEQRAIASANQLELHKWRMKVAAAEQEAAEERKWRRELSESFKEVSSVNEELAARAMELEWSSFRDSLTELANRRYFDQRLGDLTRISLESDQDFAVLVIDLDRFKNVNDTYGHVIGDKVLQATAQILLTATRRADLCARIGGEEFSVLLNGPITSKNLFTVAEKIRVAFVDFDWGKIADGLLVTASVGGALFSEVDNNPINMLGLADKRLYVAKRSGRNAVQVTD